MAGHNVYSRELPMTLIVFRIMRSKNMAKDFETNLSFRHACHCFSTQALHRPLNFFRLCVCPTRKYFSLHFEDLLHLRRPIQFFSNIIVEATCLWPYIWLIKTGCMIIACIPWIEKRRQPAAFLDPNPHRHHGEVVKCPLRILYSTAEVLNR